MGFVKDLAQVGTFGLTGLLASHKKKTAVTPPKPSMISISPTASSMIGSTRGGY